DDRGAGDERLDRGPVADVDLDELDPRRRRTEVGDEGLEPGPRASGEPEPDPTGGGLDEVGRDEPADESGGPEQDDVEIAVTHASNLLVCPRAGRTLPSLLAWTASRTCWASSRPVGPVRVWTSSPGNGPSRHSRSPARTSSSTSRSRASPTAGSLTSG